MTQDIRFAMNTVHTCFTEVTL